MEACESQQEVVDWALERGFVRRGDDLVVAYGQGEVGISPLKRNIRVWGRHGDHVVRLATVHHSRVYRNEDGMLEGMGLTSTFVQRLISDPQSALPPWFTPTYAARVEALRSEMAGGPRP